MTMLDMSRRFIKYLLCQGGRVKVNSDAAMLGDGVVGVGAVIRDAHRVVLLAGVRRFKARWLVGLAEARATKFGVVGGVGSQVRL